MQICVDFDSGNIQVIDVSDFCWICLVICFDLVSQYFQWFYFKVEGMVVVIEYCFILVNVGQLVYSYVWSGYQVVVLYDGECWFCVLL